MLETKLKCSSHLVKFIKLSLNILYVRDKTKVLFTLGKIYKILSEHMFKMRPKFSSYLVKFIEFSLNTLRIQDGTKVLFTLSKIYKILSECTSRLRRDQSALYTW